MDIATLLNVETNDKHLKKTTKRELIVGASNKNSQLRHLLKAARTERSDDQHCYHDFLIAELEELREICEQQRDSARADRISEAIRLSRKIGSVSKTRRKRVSHPDPDSRRSPREDTDSFTYPLEKLEWLKYHPLPSDDCGCVTHSNATTALNIYA
jgi:hypothetical protein